LTLAQLAKSSADAATIKQEYSHLCDITHI